MNRTPITTIQTSINNPSNNAENGNQQNNANPNADQQPLVQVRCRPLVRTDPGDTLTPRQFRRSPFFTNSGSASVQCGVLPANSRDQSVASSPLNPSAKFNSPGVSDSVGNFNEIREKLVQANLLAERANAVLNERHSNVRYHVSLQVPIHCLNQAKRENHQLQCEPVIEVRRGGVRERSLSLARMQHKLRELEANRDGAEDRSISIASTSVTGGERRELPARSFGLRIPNGDLVLIGVANLYLRCLLFVREFSYKTPILNPKGEICGRIDVEISTTIASEGQRPMQFFPPSTDLDSLNQKIFNLGGNVLELRVSIREAVGIPNAFTKKILCNYQMLGVEEPIVVLPKLESFLTQAPPDPTNLEYEYTQRCLFDHQRVFRLPLTRQTLSDLADYALSVEVYGNLQELNSNLTIPRRTLNRTQVPSNRKGVDQQFGVQVSRAISPTPARTTKLRRYRSDLDDRRKPVLRGPQTTAFAASHTSGFSNQVALRLTEEWLRVQRRVDFWVAIEELMEDGNFKKVPVIPTSDIKTGGIYQLRQGLNRRIRVLIRPNELNRKERGFLPFVCSKVSEVSVGCVTRCFTDSENGQSHFVRNRIAPDSYQEIDLEMVRHKWCNAMDEWQSYLQGNLQALAKKREKDAGDEAKEGYLLNRWVSSIQERDAILVPPPGSSLPGAAATEIPPPGLEQHTPLIFADIDRAANQPLMVGARSYLDGEESKSFVALPVIKNYATLIGALASWDSNLHESDLLNKITPPSERIYLIVKVHILVRKPVEMTLVLRKRICVKICRRSAFAAIFKSPFSRMVSNEKEDMLWTGVAYQFVAGIPKMAPYSPNSTGTELEKQEWTTIESLAGQYMRTIQSVSSELYLDGLRQEVALREALAKNKDLRQPFDLDNLGLVKLDSNFVDSGLSRSRSFNDPPKRPTLTGTMRQHSQTRPRHILYPNLAAILNETDKSPSGHSPSTPVSFKSPSPSEALKSPMSNEAEFQRLVDEFRNSSITAPQASEELMAWSRRAREKHRNVN
ncbi:hypothetical protein Aperf_G00000078047 [Anoplocephala perfoliata]